MFCRATKGGIDSLLGVPGTARPNWPLEANLAMIRCRLFVLRNQPGGCSLAPLWLLVLATRSLISLTKSLNLLKSKRWLARTQRPPSPPSSSFAGTRELIGGHPYKLLLSIYCTRDRLWFCSHSANILSWFGVKLGNTGICCGILAEPWCHAI